MADELVQKLLKKRAGYDEELAWEKFLMDAYAGTGGFQGRIRMPYAGFWGAGSELYARGAIYGQTGNGDEAQIDTYLDRYPREELPKFSRRAAIANYPNPVEPVVDIRLSYLHRKPMKRDGVEQPDVAAFLKNADGHGKSWDQLLEETIHVRAEVHGACPVLFDMPASDTPGPMTKAQAADEKLAPRAIPLFGAQLYDWHIEDGELFAVKIGTFYDERGDMLSEPLCVHRITIWYRERIETYEIVKRDGKGEDVVRLNEVRPNPWGVIPLVVFVHKAAQVPLKGISAVGSIAKLAKRLLNYLSELDEHLRSSTFAMLQVPTDAPEQIAGVLGGSGNALPVKTTSGPEYKFINPDTAVPAVYEKRIEETKKDIRENARTQYGSNDSKAAKSGMSRAFEFENMNRAIADLAKSFATGDQASLRLVATMAGVSEEEVEKILVTAPTRFEVEELLAELEQALAAKGLGFGPTALAEMLKRLVRQLLPNLDADKLAKIDREIDEEATAAEQATIAAREALAAGGEDDEEDPEDEPGKDEPPPKGPKPPPPKE